MLKVRGAVVGDPDLAVGVFTDEDLQGQVEGGAGSGEHDGCAGFRASEDQEFSGRHGQADFLRFTAVVDESEEGDAFSGEDFLERLDCLIDGLIARHFDDASCVGRHGFAPWFQAVTGSVAVSTPASASSSAEAGWVGSI